jgi:hypothetical protein
MALLLKSSLEEENQDKNFALAAVSFLVTFTTFFRVHHILLSLDSV